MGQLQHMARQQHWRHRPCAFTLPCSQANPSPCSQANPSSCSQTNPSACSQTNPSSCSQTNPSPSTVSYPNPKRQVLHLLPSQDCCSEVVQRLHEPDGFWKLPNSSQPQVPQCVGSGLLRRCLLRRHF